MNESPEIFQSAFDGCFVGRVFVEWMKKFVDQILPENDFVIVQILHGTLQMKRNEMERNEWDNTMKGGSTTDTKQGSDNTLRNAIKIEMVKRRHIELT